MKRKFKEKKHTEARDVINASRASLNTGGGMVGDVATEWRPGGGCDVATPGGGGGEVRYGMS